MNWSKYSLNEWLEQFGAWCNSCRMKSGHCPDNLSQNLIDKLMIETGYKKLQKHKNVAECKISDDEALQVNHLILSAFKRAYDKEIAIELLCLYFYKVEGYSLRRTSDMFECSTIDLRQKLHGAKRFMQCEYRFLRC